MKNELVAIVIPNYKKYLNELEKISLDRAVKVFEKYDIYFALPKSLEISVPSDIRIQRFEDTFFSSIIMYSKMMLTKEFYERFAAYKYILIYQLDAFVFSDWLEHFCNMNYDYIGAPWLFGQHRFIDCEHTIWCVGNGGFSLRKTESFIRMLEERKELVRCNRDPEDIFIASMNDADFRIAPTDVALQFAFEMDVRKCYEQNKEQLPFGCHAWGRHDLQFWKPYIENLGYVIPEEFLKKGQEDFLQIANEGKDRAKRKGVFWKEIFCREKFKDWFQNRYSSPDDKYVIWGAGYWGQLMHRLLIGVGLTVEFMIDRKKGVNHETMEDCPIITPEEYKRKNVHNNILVAVWEENREIGKWLETIGYSYQKDYIYIQDIEKNVLDHI